MMEIQLNKQLTGPNGALALAIETTIAEGGITAIHGPSGAGKTSLLRMLAGLLVPDSGRIAVGGKVWYDSQQRINLSPQKRPAGLLFQDYALFPNMTVAQNVAFAQPSNPAPQLAKELIEVMELGSLQHEKPATLSGGQLQRAALARLLAQQADVLLLDEPLAALDRAMRTRLQEYLQQYQLDTGCCMLLVSHDVAEVVKLATTVLMLENGQIVRQGSPTEMLTRKPLSGKFQFVGEVLTIDPQEVVVVLSLLIGNELVQVVADQSEAAGLVVGDQVLVASKAFNPVIQKLSKP